MAACSCAVVVSPSVKLTEVSPEEIDSSVAITAEPSNNSADPPVACPAVIDAVAVMLVLDASNVLATTVPPIAVAASEVGALGATVSITSALLAPSEPLVPGAGSARTASLPDASRITPPLRAIAAPDC